MPLLSGLWTTIVFKKNVQYQKEKANFKKQNLKR